MELLVSIERDSGVERNFLKPVVISLLFFFSL